MKITKSKLIKICAAKNKIPVYITKKIVNDFVKELAKETLKNNEVSIHGLGRFVAKVNVINENEINFYCSKNLSKIYLKGNQVKDG